VMSAELSHVAELLRGRARVRFDDQGQPIEPKRDMWIEARTAALRGQLGTDWTDSLAAARAELGTPPTGTSNTLPELPSSSVQSTRTSLSLQVSASAPHVRTTVGQVGRSGGQLRSLPQAGGAAALRTTATPESLGRSAGSVGGGAETAKPSRASHGSPLFVGRRQLGEANRKTISNTEA
jgi:hypothetical protein